MCTTTRALWSTYPIHSCTIMPHSIIEWMGTQSAILTFIITLRYMQLTSGHDTVTEWQRTLLPTVDACVSGGYEYWCQYKPHNLRAYTVLSSKMEHRGKLFFFFFFVSSVSDRHISFSLVQNPTSCDFCVVRQMTDRIWPFTLPLVHACGVTAFLFAHTCGVNITENI